MGFNRNSTVIPGKGTVLVAEPDTPAPLDWMTLDPTDPSALGDWEAMGHTSRENNVALAKDGGEATPTGSWWDEALRSNYAPTNWSVTVNSIQIDALTLGMAFGGGTLNSEEGYYDVAGTVVPQEKALFILIVDGNTRMGIYIPNTTTTVGDAPEIATDAFFEIQINAQMLNSETTGKRFRIYHPALIALVGDIPVITSATPSDAAAGTDVTIAGTDLTNATSVTFDGVEATTIVSNTATEIVATVPAGSAGSAPIVVTTAAGASDPFAYTRGA